VGQTAVSIRFARAEDFWRKTFQRPYPNRYESLSFDHLQCLGSGRVEFTSGITAIVGGNGVGKSTLVSAVGEVLEGAGALLPSENRARVRGSSLRARIVEGGAIRTVNIVPGAEDTRQISGDDLQVEGRWLEPAHWAFKTRAKVLEDENFSDLLEPIDPIHLEGDELSLASFLTGKTYSDCEIYEIQDYAGFERFPYFRVDSNGSQYSTESMGQGELALLLTLWVIRDLPMNSILILEEPETHVSPRSQAALMTYVASQCVKKGLWVVVTTHSPIVVSKIPRQSLRLLVRDGGNISILDNPHHHQVASILGGAFGYEGIVLVEDEAAKRFTVCLLEEIDADLARQFEIVVCGSNGQVVAATKAFPRTKNWLSVVGVLDGDQRGANLEAGHWPVVFLPGHQSPEETLLARLYRADAAGHLAVILQRQPHDVTAAKDAAAGLDPHDRLLEVGRNLGLSAVEMTRSLVKLWLADDESQLAAREFLQSLRASFNEDA
jgi:predicted ATPase